MAEEKLVDLNDQPKTSKTKIKKKGKIISVILGIVIFLLLIIASVYAYAINYQSKIYPGVTIAGYDAGGLTKKQALELVGKKISMLNTVGLQMQLTEEKSTYEIKYSDLGISFDKEKTVEEAYNIGRSEKSNFWNAVKIAQIIFNEEKVAPTINIDGKKFQDKINEVISNKFINAEDAKFEIVDNEIKIISEKKGTSVDYDDLKKKIAANINAENINKTIVIQTKMVLPNILESDITSFIKQIEGYINKKITYQDEYNYYSPTKLDLSKWINIKKEDGKLKIELNENSIKEYVIFLASQIDIVTIDKKIDTNSGGVITEGNDGKSLNQEKTLSDTIKVFNETADESLIVLEVQNIPRKEVKVASYKEGGSAGLADGRYIEVNLSSQTMYAYEGENQVGAYAVSTGAWDYPTPVGTRYISDKSIRPFSAQYGLYMPWWNGIGGGYGIHELPEWPGGYKEGESHLGTPVSHGCIRLGVGPAEFIYNWAPIGTPVFIHY